jgi:hypothetical protein
MLRTQRDDNHSPCTGDHPGIRLPTRRSEVGNAN